jgi:hypothetical protein
MLPLCPPSLPRDPGYPTRDRILGDRTLRRQVLGVLAAAIFSGCAGEPMPQPPTAGTPAPTTAPEPAAPGKLEGDVAAPQPPLPVPLRGESAAVQVPEPTPLRGRVVAEPPPPEPVKP